MALESCPECGKTVSSKADACPHCGARRGPKPHQPLSAGKGCLIIMIGVTVLAIIYTLATQL